MIDTRHMPAMPMDYVTLAGGNGFDDMRVSLSDPLGYVQGLMEDRTVKPFDTSNEIVVPEPASAPAQLASYDPRKWLEDWLDKHVQGAKETAKGAVVALVVGTLALLLIIFGLYYLAKD